MGAYCEFSCKIQATLYKLYYFNRGLSGDTIDIDNGSGFNRNKEENYGRTNTGLRGKIRALKPRNY